MDYFRLNTASINNAFIKHAIFFFNPGILIFHTIIIVADCIAVNFPFFLLRACTRHRTWAYRRRSAWIYSRRNTRVCWLLRRCLRTFRQHFRRSCFFRIYVRFFRSFCRNFYHIFLYRFLLCFLLCFLLVAFLCLRLRILFRFIHLSGNHFHFLACRLCLIFCLCFISLRAQKSV